MLVLFYGPSGVGKTTVMRSLAAQEGWQLVTTYMTRQRRPREIEKVTVDSGQFRAMAEAGKFFCHTRLFATDYGTPKDQILTAVHSSGELWMLDFSFQNRLVFADIPHRSVFLLPESWNQLARHLIAAGREDRLSQAKKDYYENYRHLREGDGTSERVIVVNREGDLRYALKKITVALEERTA